MTQFDVLLRRPLKSVVIRFAGAVHERRTRRDLLAVVMTIIEHAGEVTLDEVSDHLFGGRRGFAQGLLLDAERHALVDRTECDRYAVTDAGLDALRAGMVFEPVFEVWELAIAQDELVGPVPLSLRVADSVRLYDVHQGTGKYEKSAPMPRHAAELSGETVTPLTQPGSQFLLPDLELSDPFCFEGPTAFRLECSLAHAKLTVHGPGGSYPIVKALQVDLGRTLEAVVPDSDWDEEAGCLSVPTAALSDAQIVHGTLSGSWPDIDFGEAGRFTVTTDEVPIRPGSPADAAEWILRRLAADPPEPASADRWHARLERESADLGVQPVEIDHGSVLDHLEQTDRTRTPGWWGVQSAVDWEL